MRQIQVGFTTDYVIAHECLALGVPDEQVVKAVEKANSVTKKLCKPADPAAVEAHIRTLRADDTVRLPVRVDWRTRAEALYDHLRIQPQLKESHRTLRMVLASLIGKQDVTVDPKLASVSKRPPRAARRTRSVLIHGDRSHRVMLARFVNKRF